MSSLTQTFQPSLEYKLIYVFRINDKDHKGYLKIGEATIQSSKNYKFLSPNSSDLNYAARKRIDSYTSTAGIVYELLHTEVAVFEFKGKLKAFRDFKVHEVLKRSGIKQKFFDTNKKQNEWFKVDLQTTIAAIKAVKENKSYLGQSEITSDRNPVVFRPEQRNAIDKTLTQFKKNDRMLWNAKMRFGKTLSALQVIKEAGFAKSIIITHRPVVKEGWFEDFNKIFFDKNEYKFGSHKIGETIQQLLSSDDKFVYFASIQDLRGSSEVGGHIEKNVEIFNTIWDFIVIDEAHEGTKTNLGLNVVKSLIKPESNINTKLLELSGTPFNILSSYKDENIYTWDYISEQEAKTTWALNTFGDSNPYEELPKMNIFTYHLETRLTGFLDLEEKAFNFREFFRTWTGKIEKDGKRIPEDKKIGDFVHEEDIYSFLNLITKESETSNYPFSNESYRDYFRHSLWMLPGVKEAKSFSKILRRHEVFGSGSFNVVNVAGDGDEEVNSRDALKLVQEAIGNEPDKSYSITLSCGRLTTGVSVPEWTAVLMLSGSHNTSASQYLQTIFRVQTPANINGKLKENSYVFDFAPDRTLKMVAEAVQLSARSSNNLAAEIQLGKFLNFCPIISVNETSMKEYKVSNLLQELKRAYAERVVKNGFDDIRLYNDELLKLDDVQLTDFQELKRTIGVTKQSKRLEHLTINDEGFTDEKYDQAKDLEKKPKSQLTEEEKKLRLEMAEKRKNRDKAISILRGISIRIPLIVYGVDIDINDDVTIDNFPNLVDELSWNEFMPIGITKETFIKFAKYYDKDVFLASTRRIRFTSKSADELEPTERLTKIASLFASFKNPDKETVLTPWAVVNRHIYTTFGGYTFFDSEFRNTLDSPKFKFKEEITDKIFHKESKIIDINSKTGLYSLLVTYNLYKKRMMSSKSSSASKDEKLKIWDQVVNDNLFIICKTPMAKQITRRTLLGFRKGDANIHAFDNIIMQIKEKSEKFNEKLISRKFWGLRGVETMKFNAVVGNPPYQISKGGTKNIDIWHHFLFSAIKLGDYTSLIHPGRWLVPKKNMKPIHDKIFNSDSGLYSFDYYPNSRDIFKDVEIDGGITITLFIKDYEDKAEYIREGQIIGKYNNGEKFLSDRFEEEIYGLLNPSLFGGLSISSRITGNTGSLGGGEFGYKKNKHKHLLRESQDGLKKPIKVWANRGYGKGERFTWNFIEFNDLDNIPNTLLATRKVMIDKKGHAITSGRGNVINNKPKIVGKDTIASGDVLFVIPQNDTDYELDLIKSLFITKTARFLMTITQKDLYTRGFENIPDYTYFIPMLNGKLFSDQFFYENFKFSSDLIQHIENKVTDK